MKIRDKTAASSSSSSSRYSDHVTRHHTVGLPRSAPNSPIFSKRPQTAGGSDMYMPQHYSKPSLQSTSELLTSTSSSNNNNYHHRAIMFSKSPTISSQSSNSSSEMNLFQELEQHALFKTPTVDRSVSINLKII